MEKSIKGTRIRHISLLWDLKSGPFKLGLVFGGAFKRKGAASHKGGIGDGRKNRNQGKVF